MPATRFRPWILLILLWAAYFHPLLLHPASTLYSDYSDLAAEHLPGRIFLVREWRTTGELPLWNPYHFCGSPFIHDIQVGTFYPPYALTLLFHEDDAGAVMSWVIALHVLAASAFGFLYARRHGLGEVGSLVTGIGFAYSAKWLTHLILAGHTITIGLAWLPLVLLGLEAFIRNRRLAGLLGGGVAFALLILGTHPQWTFYAGLFVAAWTVPGKAGLLRWVGGGIGIVLIALLLAAVQLLPTWEASQYSTRAVGVESSQSLGAGVTALLAMFGPTADYNPPVTWEARSLLSLFGLAVAVVAPSLAAGMRMKRGVLLGLLFFSFGGAVLVEWLPGFNLFRFGARMLLIVAFPVAFLAAASTDALIASAWEKRRTLRIALLVALLGVVPAIATAQAWRDTSLPRWSEFGTYWACAALGLVAAGAATFSPNLSSRVRTGLWLAALLIELLAPTARFVEVKTQAEIYPESELVRFLNANADPAAARVLDIELGSLPTDRVAPLGTGSPQALTNRIAMPRGYNPLDVRYFREYLNFVIGYETPVISLSPIAQPIVPNFPRTVPQLWEQLNVRYLVCFEDYMTNPEFRDVPGNRLLDADWRFAEHFKSTPAVPELPPLRPDPLPRVLVMENRHHQDHPRAFVVPNSAPLPPGGEAQALKTTNLHETVLLANGPTTRNESGAFRRAAIREYAANRVAVDLGGGPGGWLVVADVWFPGWTCRIDGAEAEVYRGNVAFRAVAIPPGAKEAVFRFEPRSYLVGWWISAASLGIVVITGFGILVRSRLDAPRQAG